MHKHITKTANLPDQRTQEFFQILFPKKSGYLEIRPIQDKKDNAKPDFKRRAWFGDVSEFLKQFNALKKELAFDGMGFFFGVCPRTISGGGAKKHVTHGYCVWADMDAKDYENGWADIDRHIGQLPLAPSAIVRSGGGKHLYWFLNERTPVDRIEEVNKEIRNFVLGDHVWGRARVMRVPTSWHVKNPKAPKELEWEKFNPCFFHISELENIFEVNKTQEIDFSPKPKPRNIPKNVFKPHPRISPDLAAAFRKHETLKAYFEGREKVGGDTSPSGYDYTFAREGLWLGINEDAISDGLLFRLEGRGKGRPMEYIYNTIQRAKKDLNGRTKAAQSPSMGLDLDCYPDGHKLAGKPKKNLTNLIQILTNDPELKGKIKFDEFRGILLFRDERLADHHLTQIRLLILRAYGLEYGKESTGDGVELVGQNNKFHPVRDYIESLNWDGRHRISTYLQRCLNVDLEHPEIDPEDVNYLFKEIGKCFLLSVVARVFRPGCEVRTVLLLQGPQKLGKSAFFRIMAINRNWFSDSPIDLRGNKDTYTKMRGKLIIELSELHALRGRSNEQIKAFISSSVDEYRPAYGRYDVEVPRQNVFGGSTNPKDVFTDPTGSTRFHPVPVLGFYHEESDVPQILFEDLKAEVDQLYAEAYHLFKLHPHGRPWELNKRASEILVDYSTRFQVEDTWNQEIANWFNSHGQWGNAFTLSEIMDQALAILPHQQNRSAIMRVSSILAQNGWVKTRIRKGKKRVWAWKLEVKNA